MADLAARKRAEEALAEADGALRSWGAEAILVPEQRLAQALGKLAAMTRALLAETAEPAPFPPTLVREATEEAKAWLSAPYSNHGPQAIVDARQIMFRLLAVIHEHPAPAPSASPADGLPPETVGPIARLATFDREGAEILVAALKAAPAPSEAVREAAEAEWATRQAYAADSTEPPDGPAFHRWLNAATRLGDVVREALSSPAAPAKDEVREAAEVIRRITENHFARISERGILVYGQPVAETGFVEAIEWLRRYDAARGGE